MRKAVNHQPLEMVRGAGGAFLTMADLGKALMLAIEQPAAAGQVYNLGSLFLTWEEIGETIKKLTSSDSPIKLVPSGDWRGPPSSTNSGTSTGARWNASWGTVRGVLRRR